MYSLNLSHLVHILVCFAAEMLAMLDNRVLLQTPTGSVSICCAFQTFMWIRIVLLKWWSWSRMFRVGPGFCFFDTLLRVAHAACLRVAPGMFRSRHRCTLLPFLFSFFSKFRLIHSFLAYSSVSFDKCKRSCSHHWNQGRERFSHLPLSPSASSSHPPLVALICTPSL